MNRVQHTAKWFVGTRTTAWNIAVNLRELLIEKPRCFINDKVEQHCPPLAEVPIGGGG